MKKKKAKPKGNKSFFPRVRNTLETSGAGGRFLCPGWQRFGKFFPKPLFF